MENQFPVDDDRKVWSKYCGFLDLDQGEFTEIQQDLLMEQIGLVAGRGVCASHMPEQPRSVDEFRSSVALTTADDWFPILNERDESTLPQPAHCWTHTSGRGGSFKWVPYTERAFQRFTDYGITAIILACAGARGDVKVGRGLRLLYNAPPRPYLSGMLADSVTEALGAVSLPPRDRFEGADFATRVRAGFQYALRGGVDVLGSMTSVLVKMGERFADASSSMKFGAWMLNPPTLRRLLRGRAASRREHRGMLPRDLWPLKGLICYGMDTDIYRDRVVHYWGCSPIEGYAATESGGIATQSWTKRGMTLLPTSCFYEFIPEDEWARSREDSAYLPTTVLAHELEAGRSYELVITSFDGMPFLRYRIGDLVTVTAIEDTDAGIRLPQITFSCRADDLIDIAGFTRLDERSVWQAIVNTGIRHEDWTIRKEPRGDAPVLRLYMELKDTMEAEEVVRLVQRELELVNRNYRDLRSMLEMEPLEVTLLEAGSFTRYYEARQREGADLAHLKPPHMNASDQVIKDLLGRE